MIRNTGFAHFITMYRGGGDALNLMLPDPFSCYNICCIDFFWDTVVQPLGGRPSHSIIQCALFCYNRCTNSAHNRFKFLDLNFDINFNLILCSALL